MYKVVPGRTLLRGGRTELVIMRKEREGATASLCVVGKPRRATCYANLCLNMLGLLESEGCD